MALHDSRHLGLRPSDGQVTVHYRGGRVVRRGISDSMHNDSLCMFSGFGSQALGFREDGSNALGIRIGHSNGNRVRAFLASAGGSCRLSNDCRLLHCPYANRALVTASDRRIHLWYAGRFSVRVSGWSVGSASVASPKSAASRRMPNRSPAQRAANLGSPVIAISR
jgi:hypothetical protein